MPHCQPAVLDRDGTIDVVLRGGGSRLDPTSPGLRRERAPAKRLSSRHGRSRAKGRSAVQEAQESGKESERASEKAEACSGGPLHIFGVRTMFFRAVRSMLFGLARIVSQAESAGQEHAPGRPAPDGNSAGTSQVASTGFAGRAAARPAIRTRARPKCALEQTQKARVNRGT